MANINNAWNNNYNTYSPVSNDWFSAYDDNEKRTKEWMDSNSLAYGDQRQRSMFSNLFGQGGTSDDAFNLKVSDKMNTWGLQDPSVYANYKPEHFDSTFTMAKANPNFSLANARRSPFDNFMSDYGKPMAFGLNAAGGLMSLYGGFKQLGMMEDENKRADKQFNMTQTAFNRQIDRDNALGGVQYAPDRTNVA